MYGIIQKNPGKPIGNIFEIIEAITSNVVLDKKTGKYKVDILDKKELSQYNLKQIERLMYELNWRKEKASGKRLIELNKMYNKLFVMKKYITDNFKEKQDKEKEDVIK